MSSSLKRPRGTGRDPTPTGLGPLPARADGSAPICPLRTSGRTNPVRSGHFSRKNGRVRPDAAILHVRFGRVRSDAAICAPKMAASGRTRPFCTSDLDASAPTRPFCTSDLAASAPTRPISRRKWARPVRRGHFARPIWTRPTRCVSSDAMGGRSGPAPDLDREEGPVERRQELQSTPTPRRST